MRPSQGFGEQWKMDVYFRATCEQMPNLEENRGTTTILRNRERINKTIFDFGGTGEQTTQLISGKQGNSLIDRL